MITTYKPRSWAEDAELESQVADENVALEARCEKLERENAIMRQVFSDYAGSDWPDLVLWNPTLISDEEERDEMIAELAFHKHLEEEEGKRQLRFF